MVPSLLEAYTSLLCTCITITCHPSCCAWDDKLERKRHDDRIWMRRQRQLELASKDDSQQRFNDIISSCCMYTDGMDATSVKLIWAKAARQCSIGCQDVSGLMRRSMYQVRKKRLYWRWSNLGSCYLRWHES